MKKHQMIFTLSLVTLLLSSCQQEREVQSSDELQTKSSSIVVGDIDNRKPILTYDSSIVSIMSESGSTLCSGTVIGPKHIITAAHCFYDPELDEIKKDRYIVPGYNHAQDLKPHQRFFINNLYIPSAYITETKGFMKMPITAFIHDIAIVEIKDTLGNKSFAEQTQSVPVEAFDETLHLNINEVSLKAFHGDLAYSTPYEEKDCSFDIIYRSGLIGHTCDNYKGSSGSSLQLNQSIVALNTGEQETDYNIGTPLTYNHVESIEAIFNDSQQVSFEKFEVNQKPFIGIDVFNSCDQEILIAFYFKNNAGDWDFKGHYRIHPGDLFISPVESTSDHIYYHIQTPDRSFTWEGEHPIENTNGQIFNMLELKTETRYYDHRLKVDCN